MMHKYSDDDEMNFARYDRAPGATMLQSVALILIGFAAGVMLTSACVIVF